MISIGLAGDIRDEPLTKLELCGIKESGADDAMPSGESL